jgi:acetyltransferase
MLTEPEAKAALAAYGMPVSEVRTAREPVEVGDIASDMLKGGGALVVKVLSREIVHKSDIGGVALDIDSPAAAEDAALAIEKHVLRALPDALIDGFTVQPMVRRPAAQELILGVAHDPVFGPVILFGAGGVAVELLQDTAVALPPLDTALAADLIAQTRAGALLAGFRGRPAADAEALQSALVALSHMIEDLPAISAIDVNPVLADASGVIALDARIEIDPKGLDRPAPNPDLAIRPYPAAWKGAVAIRDGTVTIRPILPVDAHLYRDFLARLDPEDIRMRFMAARKHFPDDMGLRLSQLDYDRDMAFVAIDEAGALAGVSRMACDPDRTTAEYALIVRSDLGGRGLGTALMTRLIDYARAEGVKRLEGMVLSENRGMRALVGRLGFHIEPMIEEPGVVMSSLAL